MGLICVCWVDPFDWLLGLIGSVCWVNPFDRLRLLGLIICSVDRLMGLIFFHMGLIHMVLVSLF